MTVRLHKWIAVTFLPTLITVAVYRVAVSLSLHWVWPKFTEYPQSWHIDFGPICIGWLK